MLFAPPASGMINPEEQKIEDTTYKGVVACDVEDACQVKDWMCICQKLMFDKEYRSDYIKDAGTDEICKKWKKDGKIPDDKCLTKVSRRVLVWWGCVPDGAAFLGPLYNTPSSPSSCFYRTFELPPAIFI